VSPELLRALLTILFGALAGGFTNTVAVWMLFHPHTPPRVGRLRIGFLHGAIPKNQDRLATAVGRAVGDRLLTHEDLTRTLSNRDFRDAFDAQLQHFLGSLLERERGSLRELLPPGLNQEVEELLGEVAAVLGARVEEWIDSPDFEARVEVRVRALLSELSTEPVAELLTRAREEALLAAADEWLAGFVEREDLRRTLEDYLDRTMADFLQEDRTFEEVLPAGLVDSMERALSDYLPLAVRRLGGILEDPDARRSLENTVHDLFQRFLSDLRFHQRVVARLVVTQETLERVLTTIEEEGAEHLSEMLRDPAVQDAMARKVNAAVLDFLQRPVTSVLGHPGDASVLRARDTIAGWILGLTRDPATRGFVVEKLGQGLQRAAGGTWGELLGRIPPEQLARAMVSAARSDAARRGIRDAADRGVRGLLDRPIGRPADWLPSGGAPRIQEALSDPLWSWLQAQSPRLVRMLDVGRRVEDKVRGYPTPKMEELVRRVTHRELRLIVRLGYVLGAFIGGILVAVNALLT
jgi:uncharacterized membrane protein YheB (UPF0754 family)